MKQRIRRFRMVALVAALAVAIFAATTPGAAQAPPAPAPRRPERRHGHRCRSGFERRHPLAGRRRPVRLLDLRPGQRRRRLRLRQDRLALRPHRDRLDIVRSPSGRNQLLDRGRRGPLGRFRGGPGDPHRRARAPGSPGTSRASRRWANPRRSRPDRDRRSGAAGHRGPAPSPLPASRSAAGGRPRAPGDPLPARRLGRRSRRPHRRRDQLLLLDRRRTRRALRARHPLRPGRCGVRRRHDRGRAVVARAERRRPLHRRGRVPRPRQLGPRPARR